MDLDQKDIENIKKLNLVSDELIQLLVDELESEAEMRCYGIDILVEEGKGGHKDIYLIDLNNMPSFNDIPPINDHMKNLFNKIKSKKSSK